MPETAEAAPALEGFAIVRLADGEPPPANCVAHGGMQGLFTRLDFLADTEAMQTAADAARAELADACRQRDEISLRNSLDTIDHLTARLDALVAEEAAAIQAKLDAGPDPDAPTDLRAYRPGGELHAVAAVEEPPVETEGDAADTDVLPSRLSRAAPIASGGALRPKKELAYPPPVPMAEISW
jgi:hypothetical protein